jgi:lipid-binding SYLF domain-containing protein
MMKTLRLTIILLVLAFAVSTLLTPNAARAASAAELNRDAKKALQRLYKESSSAKALGEKAKAILVFPSVVKAGFMIGGLFGEGVLLKDGKEVGYYDTVAASYGLQAGAQKYGYAMFLMNDAAIQYLDKSDGWEVGTGPSIVVMDKGAAGGMSTTTAMSDVYAFIFSQTGLMGGLGLQGTKITKIKK